MKRLLLSFGFALAFATPAFANDVLDLSTVKCKEWIESGTENIGYTMAWIDGYYQDENADPIIDFTKMKTNASKLAAFCAANPSLGLGTAAERILGKK
jgi:acid stress chaperone HdeB